MLNLAVGLARRGVNVCVVCSEVPPKFQAFFKQAEKEGVKLLKAKPYRTNFFYWLSLIFKTIPSLGKVDIVQLHDIRTGSIIGSLAKLFGKTVVLALGGDPDLELHLYRVKGWRKLKVKVYWWLSRKVADRICPCSNWLSASVIDKHPNLLDKLVPIHYPIRLGSAAPHGERFVLFAARLHFVKGVDVLIKAMSRIVKRLPRVKLIICGEGEEEPNLKKLTSDLKLSKNVVFLGFKPDVDGYMKGCLFLVHPSRYEPMGMALLEAMAYGKPVVASKVGGIPEIVHDGETGFLVPPEDPDALAEAMVKLLSDPVCRKRMGEKCKEWAKRFYPERVTEDYARVYAEVGKTFYLKNPAEI
jgi:glycosyltransferase involved in cell wall biosynthesis